MPQIWYLPCTNEMKKSTDKDQEIDLLENPMLDFWFQALKMTVRTRRTRWYITLSAIRFCECARRKKVRNWRNRHIETWHFRHTWRFCQLEHYGIFAKSGDIAIVLTWHFCQLKTLWRFCQAWRFLQNEQTEGCTSSHASNHAVEFG